LSLLAPLSAALLVSGLDDLFVDAVWAWAWLKARLWPAPSLFPPGKRQLEAARQAPIAIFIPLWREHEVIARMLEHNLASIRYANYHIFAGCYPNDPATRAALESVVARFSQVHVAICPHDGPTSKADCLNWIYQHMLLDEESSGRRFEIVVTHDAEDLVHPEELRWINYYAARYDFVQTPVLPLPTPFWEVTHGVYIDEFAEYHSRDMVVRSLLGGFVPSSGVGTGYRREALERLAAKSSNRIFAPEALTEDYDNGLRLKRLGATQAFVPLAPHGPRNFVATREFFPRTFGGALRQRTRWTIGIALQSWQKFGWRGSLAEIYWLWRDRKGLLANPLSVAANAMLVYGLGTGTWNRATPAAMKLASGTFLLMALRVAVRIACVARIYGIVLAMGAPLRAVYANVLNSAATFQALAKFFHARVRGQPLKWVKTEHAYPSRATLLAHRQMLGEILISAGRITAAELAEALRDRAVGERLGEHLVRSRKLSERELYESLAFQQGLPLAELEASRVPLAIARALPRRVAVEFTVLPFRVATGVLDIASPEAPATGTAAEIGRFTKLELRFHLVTPGEFRRLAEALL
jgi:adsorption protein B